eukprot:2772122-Amphidinium_carterae.1
MAISSFLSWSTGVTRFKCLCSSVISAAATFGSDGWSSAFFLRKKPVLVKTVRNIPWKID